MRRYLILISLALILAFSAGLLVRFNRAASPEPSDPIRQIQSLRETFRRGHTPTTEIDLSTLFPGADPRPFLDPQTALPQLAAFSFPTMARLFREAESCRFGAPLPTDERLRKAELWQAARCGRLTRLPRRFFETPPYFHPLGKSYALLATEGGATDSWVHAHLPFFHVTEARTLAQPLEPARRLLADLDPESLRAVAEGEETVLGDPYVLLRQSRAAALGWSTDSGARYAVFSRAIWDRYWMETPFSPGRDATAASCLWRDGQLCWSLRPKSLRRPTLLLLGSALVLASLCVAVAVNELRRQRDAETRKRFALQTLTHELRTPVAGLRLAAEEVLDQFDAIPETLQGALLGICNDVQRLNRVVEASKGYLGSRGGIVQLRPQTLPSIQEYLQECLEGYADRMTIRLPDEDRAFRADPYWLGVCLTNLVDNALHHGTAPVEAAFAWRGRVLEIAVTDSGSCPPGKLAEWTKPFVKSPTSSGLGLGLAIVKTVVAAMRSELRFSAAPTRFWFRLEEM